MTEIPSEDEIALEFEESLMKRYSKIAAAEDFAVNEKTRALIEQETAEALAELIRKYGIEPLGITVEELEND